MLTKTSCIVKETLIQKGYDYILSIYPDVVHNNKIKIILNEPCGNFFYDNWRLKKEYQNTPLETLYNSLIGRKGEARIIIMQPGDCYMAHSDIDNRWHMNLSGEQCFLIDLNLHNMYELVKDASWWYMDAGVVHTAVNFGDHARMQLVVRELLKSSNTASVAVSITTQVVNGRYIFDKNISPFLNSANKVGKISNFKFDGSTASFKLCESLLENFKTLNLENMVVTYE